MNRIENALNNGKKNLITFVTGGDPNIETTKKLIHAMAEAGSALIEIGIPFSDPVAEGPVIQSANERALLAGTTTDSLFEMVKELRTEIEVPMVFLTYINPIYAYGKERFFARCKDCGVDGVIVPDLPYEEKDEIEEECAKYGVSRIPLIAPTSGDRVRKLATGASGYIYVVSSLGVTGVRKTYANNLDEIVENIKSVSDTPVAIGFGISDKESAEKMWGIADNIIIGSAIVRIVEQYGEESPSHVREYVKGILG